MEGFMSALPRIISVDDHVIKPMNLWADRLPTKYHDRAPRIERRRGTPTYPVPDKMVLQEGDGPGARWCDIWVYEDLQWPMYAGHAQVRLHDPSLDAYVPVTFEEFAPGCYEQCGAHGV
jgi:hypothetical protein